MEFENGKFFNGRLEHQLTAAVFETILIYHTVRVTRTYLLIVQNDGVFQMELPVQAFQICKG